MNNKYVVVKVDKENWYRSITLDLVYDNYKEAISDCSFCNKHEEKKNFE